MGSPVFDISSLHVNYGDVPILNDINIHVGEGEIIAIIGSNCAGKSTLLKAVSSLVPTKSGLITFKEVIVNSLPPHKVVELGIVLVFEGRRLFPVMTVEENLLLGAYVSRARSEMRATLAEVYELFPRLAERRNQVAYTLSGGEQQMLAIGRGLMARPKLLMLDEPSLGLSPMLVDEIFKKIMKVNDMGVTVLLVEQNVHLSLAICSRGYVMENGCISLEGPSADLLKNEEVKRCYLGIC